MLVKKTLPDGEKVLVRKASRPEDHTVPAERLEALRSMGDFSVRQLLEMRDGPFESDYYIDEVQRDGKTWWRFIHGFEEWGFEIEDSENPLRWGALRELPPDEALAASRALDGKRGRRVIEEP